MWIFDGIVNGLAALSINHVEREEKVNRSEIEDMIQNAVAKTMKNLNKKQTQQRVNKPRGDGQPNRNITFDNADVRFVEFTEKDSTDSSEYLKIELLGEDKCSNIRAFSKRKRKDDIDEVLEPLGKKGKVEEVKHEHETIMTVRRIEVEDLGIECEDDWSLSVLNKTKNKEQVLVHEIEPVEYETLDGLTFCGWVNYWNCDSKRKDGSIQGKDALVVSRLIMENSALINLGPKMKFDLNTSGSSSGLEEVQKNQMKEGQLNNEEWDGEEYVSSEDNLLDYLED
ncbi:6322_t:CDS:2, partial [Cetraspora pellucida]